MNNDINAINEVFRDYGVQVTETVEGSQVTRYKLLLPTDVKLQGRIRRSKNDIEYTLKSALDDESVIYGKSGSYLYVEKKAQRFSAVRFEDYIDRVPKKGLYLLLGRDINGQNVYTNLQKAPHILVAGTTGSGKSELLHCFIASLIYKRNYSPCYIYIIDPKRAEFSDYTNRDGIEVITDMSKAVRELKKAVDLMEYRYSILAKNKVKDISQLDDSNMYPVVFVIDEIADLIMQYKESEKYLVRIAQKARACGIHLILGTQRPTRDVITGLIKANVPTRIALSCTTSLESRIIIDRNGAENLVGKGDMLYLGNGALETLRIQGAYVSPEYRKQLVEGLSYVPKEEVQEQLKTTKVQLIEHYRQEGFSEDVLFYLQHGYYPNEQPHRPQPKQHVGLFQAIANLFKVKPVMFKTDDYPPKI